MSTLEVRVCAQFPSIYIELLTEGGKVQKRLNLREAILAIFKCEGGEVLQDQTTWS